MSQDMHSHSPDAVGPRRKRATTQAPTRTSRHTRAHHHRHVGMEIQSRQISPPCRNGNSRSQEVPENIGAGEALRFRISVRFFFVIPITYACWSIYVLDALLDVSLDTLSRLNLAHVPFETRFRPTETHEVLAITLCTRSFFVRRRRLTCEPIAERPKPIRRRCRLTGDDRSTTSGCALPGKRPRRCSARFRTGNCKLWRPARRNIRRW